VGAPGDIVVRWTSGLEFDGVAPGGRAVHVDADSRAGPSPVELLLIAAATCTGADIVSILEKQRVTLRTLDIGVRGQRRDLQPRCLTAVVFQVTLAGAGADEAKARRAIALSLEKYCSVLASLAPQIQVSYDVTLA
jgi:putative redox protein